MMSRVALAAGVTLADVHEAPLVHGLALLVVRRVAPTAGTPEMLNAPLVAVPWTGLLVAVSVYPAAAVLSERLANVATPPETVWVSVPESVLAPGFAPIATVTV